MIPVVALAEVDGYYIGNGDVWSAPIKLDPKWNHGDYYGKAEPLDGLSIAFKALIYQAQNYGSVSKTIERKWAQDGKDPAKSWDNRFMAEQALDDIGAFLASITDANSFLYQIKAINLFVAGDGPSLDEGLAKVNARLLILPAHSDLMVYPRYSQDAAERLRRLGKSAEYHEIPGEGGHLDAVNQITAVGDLIRGFLNQ